MAATDFFARWTKAPTPASGAARSIDAPRSDGDDAHADCKAPPSHAGNASDDGAMPRPILTAADAAALQPASDFRPFMARGVDPTVQRLALKQLFATPHFNIMDGLDTYIEDFNTFVPMDAAMVASLNHGKALLDPLGQLLKPVMTLVEREAAPMPAVAGQEPNAGIAPITAAADVTGTAGDAAAGSHGSFANTRHTLTAPSMDVGSTTADDLPVQAALLPAAAKP